MTIQISIEKKDTAFIREVERLSGQNLLVCYQCGRCSAGCPMADYMDILPNRLIRLAQMGKSKILLESKTIWACASCLTCNSRCPKGVNIAEIIEAIRQINLRARKDHLDIDNLDVEPGEDLPPIALISSMRKFTS